MQVWREADGNLEKVLVKPRRRQIDILKIEKAKNPLVRFWLTYLDETCSDGEIKNMLRQARFRKKPYFEEVVI